MLKCDSVALGQPPFVRGTGGTLDLDGEIRENICVLGRGLSSNVIIFNAQRKLRSMLYTKETSKLELGHVGARCFISSPQVASITHGIKKY